MDETQDGRWHDLMYNNRARVPDSGDAMRRWAERSEAARATPARELDVAYGDDPTEKLDIFMAQRPAAPVLVFIHGGYWRAMDKKDHSFLGPAFAQEGACVVIPNYALCPAVTVPDIVLQMVRAVAWTWRNIARFGGDPRRITVAGHSAGGHLAAMMLACSWDRHAGDLPPDVVRSALAISALHDLEPIMRTPFLQADLHLTPEQVERASPARLPAPAHGTLYTAVGGEESAEYLRLNRLIQERWGERRVPVCEALPGLNHFSILDALATPGHRLHRLALELLSA